MWLYADSANLPRWREEYGAANMIKALFLAIALIGSGITTPSAFADQTDEAFVKEAGEIFNVGRSSNEFLAKLSDAEFGEFLTCAKIVVANAPKARKQYVLAGTSPADRRARFSEILYDSGAALRKKLADC